MKNDLKNLVAYIAPCGVVGFILGLAQVNIYFSLLACFFAQYYFKKTDVGTLLGLSTFLYGPIAFTAYIIGKALVT
ncbi:MAG: hypothetical protein PHX60_06800 [Giesbergeria sp.]|uniref:hypothetical protein n=1 Tax=Giesbergeria sp. TaxID=2818473 RepID=UPI00261FA938|nr:hypothetical protein [Giesbergeria sp.]MDD2609393.1 hypothetical protein [Giesbergeria sp.]